MRLFAHSVGADFEKVSHWSPCQTSESLRCPFSERVFLPGKLQAVSGYV